MFELGTTAGTILDVVDVSKPTHPVVDCTISGALRGEFVGSPTRVLFWDGDRFLGVADLATQSVSQIAQLAFPAFEGNYNRDGSKFAYKSVDTTGAETTHIFTVSSGLDQVLYTQPPVGGHGGPPVGQGPFDQLSFSPDGTLLLDYSMFRPTGSVDNLMVFNAAGAAVLQETGQVSGTWAPAGATLYYPVWGEGGPTGEVDSFSVASGSTQVASGLKQLYWPAMSPDGQSIAFDAYDNSVPGCGGVPHIWRLDLATGRAVQISKAVSSEPVFVSAEVVWSNHEAPMTCGIGGASAVDGAIVAHDLITGADTSVDMSFASAAPPGFARSVGNLMDVLY